jgi:hypothetical protein
MEIMTRERWRIIPGTNARYEASSHGRIRNRLTRYILTHAISTWGYPVVRIFFGGKSRCCRVHRLVMFAFAGPRPSTIHVNHIDGTKTNNLLTNLEYVTVSQNCRHAIRTGLSSNDPLHPRHATLTAVQVRRIRRLADRKPRKELARRFGVSVVQISRILSGKCWARVA